MVEDIGFGRRTTLGHSLSLTNRKKSGFNDRSTSTVRRLLMYKNSKPFYDKKGQIEKEAPFQSKTKSGKMVRVEPNIRWFSNTRVVTQDALDRFRGEIANAVVDPYRFVMKPSKAPLSLLSNTSKHSRSHLLEVESFRDTFSTRNGKQNIKKIHKHHHHDLESLIQTSQSKLDNFELQINDDYTTNNQYTYKDGMEQNLIINNNDDDDDEDINMDDSSWRHGKMRAGSTKKFWNEVYKVIDSSHVIIEVIDSRDPIGTRCHAIEKYLKHEKPFKNLILVLNKCDLIPSSILKKWLFILSREHPVVAFKATKKKQFGKENLMNVLRQFVRLHKIKENQHLCVGLLGYPNVGKSSIINTLKDETVCKVAPIPGQTQCWQYVSLTRHIYLIDCPGVVRTDKINEEDVVLRGVVKVENLKNPEKYVPKILELANHHHLCKIYGLLNFKEVDDFLEQVAHKRGRLLPGGIADLRTVSASIIRDWQFGKIPHYVAPPQQLLDEATQMKNEKSSISSHVIPSTNVNDESIDSTASTQMNVNSKSSNESNDEKDQPKNTNDQTISMEVNDYDFDVDSENDERLESIQFDIELDELDCEDTIFRANNDNNRDDDILVNKNNSKEKQNNKLTSQQNKLKTDEANIRLKCRFLQFLTDKRDPNQFWEYANNDIKQSRAIRKKIAKRKINKTKKK